LEILLVLVGVESINDLPQNIKMEVGVSDILVDQLLGEIYNRLFSWIDKIYISKTQVENSIEKQSHSILELPPNDLPMVEEGEVAHDVSKSGISTPRYIPPTDATVLPVSPSPVETPITIEQPSAFIPTPPPVSPPYAPAPRQLSHESLADVALTRSPVRDTQLNKNPEVQKTVQSTQPQPQTPPSAPDNLPGIEIIPERKYTVDPYREPIE